MATYPKSTPPEKHTEIPIWNAENWYWEDITPGRQIRSIRRTLSEGECEVFEDEDMLVLYCEHLQTVKYRDPASAKV